MLFDVSDHSRLFLLVFGCFQLLQVGFFFGFVSFQSRFSFLTLHWVVLRCLGRLRWLVDVQCVLSLQDVLSLL